ncbi:MAG: DUF1585 domain-containing protein, partial [Pedosphaera parvula]|nr:DUF1585 domain-containing protein [Pedosphaera parvula]
MFTPPITRLENFDAIGAWRDQDGKFPIDATGKLVSGESFKGPAELTAILARQKKDLFIRCLTQKMLIYALGRGLEYYDRCTVDRIMRDMEKQGYKFSSLVMG